MIKVYILSIEGDKETINDFLENMKDTWSLDEKNSNAKI